MGNIQTVEYRNRKPIFQKNNRSYTRKSYTPPPSSYGKNSLYIHPQKYKDILKTSNFTNYHYPSSYSKYKYIDKATTPDFKKNNPYSKLEKKLSRRQIRNYSPSLSKSFCGATTSKRHNYYDENIYNYSRRSMIGDLRHHSPSFRQQQGTKGHRQIDFNSKSFYQQNSHKSIPKCSFDNIPTQRKGPSWYNQQLVSSSQQICEQNRYKCNEIIKKVRNFNDFLNQIKKKIRIQQQSSKKQTQETYEDKYFNKNFQLMNHTYTTKNVNNKNENSAQATYQQKQSKEISLMFKLQNQKMQLEKYRKMIERELSKQHSISSISISDRQGPSATKQKIIKIQYQTNKQQTSRKQPKSHEYNEKQYQQIQDKFQKTRLISLNHQNKSVKQQKIGQFSNIKLRTKYQEVVQKLQELGTIIKEQSQVNDSDTHYLQQRVQNINTLMKHLQSVNHKDQSEKIRKYFQNIAPSFTKGSHIKASQNLITLKNLQESDDDI